MARNGKTQYVLLGLIATGPKTGYEIKQTIERSIGYFWQESYGQIYPALHTLTGKKYISKKTVPQDGRPDKIVYSITKTGIAYFKAWLVSPLQASPQRNELLLRIFFGPVLDIAENIQLLENHMQEAAKLYRTFLQIRTAITENCAIDSGPVENSMYSMLTLDYGIMSLEMEVAWAQKAIKQLQHTQNKTPGGKKL